MKNSDAIVYGDFALRAVALAATPAATANTGVLVMAGADQNEGFGALADWVTRDVAGSPAANGSSWTILQRGIYHVQFSVLQAATLNARVGINFAGTAAQLLAANQATLADTQTRDVDIGILPAATQDMRRVSALIGIPQSVANAGTGIIRILGSDNASGPLPAANVVVAQALVTIRRVADLNSRS